MGRRYDTVSFLSDFGSSGGFVGQVRSVIRDLAPHATVVDLDHEVPPFDVRAGSLTLARCVPSLPEGVILAVVDPGVGTDRAALAVEVAGGSGVFVGPDNGVLAPAVSMAGGAGRAVSLTATDFHLPRAGATCAGRDVFAPVAAHLCNGVDLAELGDLVDPGLLMPGVIPLPRDEAGVLICEVLWVDRFGNCQLNIGPDELAARWPLALGDRLRVEVLDTVGGRRARSVMLAATFGHLAPGEVGMIEDGYGMLSLCVDRSSAAVELELDTGDQVLVSLGAEEAGRSTAPLPTPVTLRPNR